MLAGIVYFLRVGDSDALQKLSNYIWERMAIWEEYWTGERNRDQESERAEGGKHTDGPEDVNRERERRLQKRGRAEDRKKEGKKQAVWDLKGPRRKVGKEETKAKQVVSLKLGCFLSIADTEQE